MKTNKLANNLQLLTVLATLLVISGCETAAQKQYKEQYAARQAAAEQQRAAAERELQEKMALLKKGMTLDEVEGVIGPLPAGFRERFENLASSMQSFKGMGIQVNEGAYGRIIMGRYELTFDSQGKLLTAKEF